MIAEQPRIGDSAAKWQLEIHVSASSTIHSGSKTATSTLPPVISAGIDLALGWVEEDCGAGLVHEAARELVLFLRRPGGQPQMSISLAAQGSEMMLIRELQIWIAEHLEKKLSVEDLADRMSMSMRNFERLFTREVGTTRSDTCFKCGWRRGASSARTHGERVQAGGLDRRIRQRRRDETRLWFGC